VTVLVPAEVSRLQPWVDAGVLEAPELHAAAVVARHLGSDIGALWADERVALAHALAVRAPRHGHACVDLDTVADVTLGELAAAAADDGDSDVPAGLPALPWPEPKAWRRALGASRAVRVVERHDDTPVYDDRPLVLHGSLLYTQRQWIDEGVVASVLRNRAGVTLPAVADRTRSVVDTLLPPALRDSNTQHAAALTAVTSPLAVVVGGPGTGKTHTIACLLAALLADVERPLRVGLAAPTGKAAARMTEAIVAVGASVGESILADSVPEQLDELKAVTVHRLLGPRPEHRTRFTHTAENPLPYDVVVIDETSMLALPMMARLLEAVPAACRLVLVGDPDQLTSIDAGAVLGDVVRAAQSATSPLRGAVVRLTTQHRTGVTSPIGPLAEAIRRGNADDVLDLLRAGDLHDRLTFRATDDGDRPNVAWPAFADVDAVRVAVGDVFAEARLAAQQGDRSRALELAGSARILCAHRRGPAGVATWNRHVEDWLLGEGRSRRDYSGRAVLATRNDPRIGIANGEAGILVRAIGPDGERGPLRAAFQRGDAISDFAPAELDELVTAFAMTIHKSQGSEYDTVVVVHPPSASPLISRELLYTAVTRARQRLVVVGSEASIRKAVETPTHRVTGLAAALR
jgi:exodeoxyribonuclease V alpha subunit